WERKPPEELYDLRSDPDEIKNLANSARHQGILKRLRRVQQDWSLRIRDIGFLPEGEIHSRAANSSPYEIGHNAQRYPIKRIMGMAEIASNLKPKALGQLREGLKDKDSAVRYWAALGILMRGSGAVAATTDELVQALTDPSNYVRIVAAEALGQFGSPSQVE